MVMPPRKVIRMLKNLSCAFLLCQQQIPGENSSSTEIKHVSMCDMERSVNLHHDHVALSEKPVPVGPGIPLN